MSSPAPSCNVSNDPSLHRHKSDILNVAIFLSYKACDGVDDDDGGHRRHGANKKTETEEKQSTHGAAVEKTEVVRLDVKICGVCAACSEHQH